MHIFARYLQRLSQKDEPMHYRRLTFLVLICCTTATLVRGEIWDLNACIAYAKAQNLTVQKSRMSAAQSDVELKLAKAAYWPSLSLSSGHRYSNTPFPETIRTESQTESQRDANFYSGNVGLNASWQIYSGARQKNIEIQRLNSQMAELDVARSENDVAESVMRVFANILYAQESVVTCQNALSVSENQRQRGEEMLAAGSIARSDLAQLESQCSNDRYALVSAQSALRNYKLQLKQLLELDATTEMELALPNYADDDVLALLPAREVVYARALELRPEIQSGEIEVESAELSVKKAKAGYAPNISLSAGTSTGWNYANEQNFGDQVKYQWSNTVGLNLSLPLVDGRETKSAVEKARLQKKTSELNSLEERKTLLKNIESYWNDALNAQEQYRAALEQQSANQTSYDLVAEQFAVGLKNATELLTAQNDLMAARQAVLQAKYMAVYNANMLRFYQGEELK